MTILVLDLDGFKPINDRYGHETGDDALIETARRLTALVRSEELLARWGGDEFVIVQYTEKGNSTAARSLAARILASIREPIQRGEVTLTLGCSIGGTLWDPNADLDWNDAFAVADSALYRSKRTGKGRFTLV